MVLGVLGTAALAGGAVFVALALLEERIIFHPSRLIEATPDAAGLPYEDLRLRTKDGETLAGWLVTAPSPRATILFLHGNAGNLSHRLHHLAGLRGTGFSVLIIDYRGYGESSGSPSEEGLYRDARAAWEELTLERGVPARRLVLYGESIGSAVALHLAVDLRRAGEEGPGAIVLEGAFTSAVEMGRRIFPFLPIRWIARSRFDNLSAVREVGAPTLFIHAGRDEVVPIWMGRRLHAAAAAAAVKEFHEVPGAGHNTTWLSAAPPLQDVIRGFVDRVIPREGRP